MLLNNKHVIVLLFVVWRGSWNGVFSHCSPSQICDTVRFLSSTTTMATPEAALKLEIARLTGIVSPLAYVDVFS
jgi:hypothetical protein